LKFSSTESSLGSKLPAPSRAACDQPQEPLVSSPCATAQRRKVSSSTMS
jgi:hypothetical protein